MTATKDPVPGAAAADYRDRRWRGRLPLYNSECAPCDAKSICGAGCAWNALELQGDPLALDDAMCLLTRKVFDRLIWSDRPTEAADDVW